MGLTIMRKVTKLDYENNEWNEVARTPISFLSILQREYNFLPPFKIW